MPINLKRYYVFKVEPPYGFAVCKASSVEDGYEQLNLLLHMGLDVRYLYVTDDAKRAFGERGKPRVDPKPISFPCATPDMVY